FGENHTWTFMNKSGVAMIGVSDLLQKITGEAHIEYLKSENDSITKGDAIAKLWNESKYLTITSPISGKMLSRNSDLIDKPSLMNADPYRKGWFIKMEPSHWLSDIGDLKVADNASTWMKSELKRFKEFLPFSMSSHSPELQAVTLQDGGEMVEYPLMALSEPVWNDFQKAFLD
ncbi:glycine cleavage system protein H, partial [bacterium]|nr:glycine cleavage system protein H [bacterium]